jgi:hypothetical protein
MTLARPNVCPCLSPSQPRIDLCRSFARAATLLPKGVDPTRVGQTLCDAKSFLPEALGRLLQIPLPGQPYSHITYHVTYLTVHKRLYVVPVTLPSQLNHNTQTPGGLHCIANDRRQLY